ncbi:MAG: response regulator transcription factor [Terriglobales bacterium]
MNRLRILVADDHPVFRLGLCSLLSSHEGWEICGEAADGRQAVEKCKGLKPDLLILDICLPYLNGVDAARQILNNNPAQKILVVTDVNSEQVVQDCLAAGVRGWIFKSDAIKDLTLAVEELLGNKPAFSKQVSDLIIEGYLRRHNGTSAVPGVSRLTSREREVLQLLSEGRTNKEISTTLNVAVKTIETHRSHMMSKLKLHSVAQLVMYAVRNDIIHVSPPAVLRFPNPRADEGPVLLRNVH